MVSAVKLYPITKQNGYPTLHMDLPITTFSGLHPSWTLSLQLAAFRRHHPPTTNPIMESPSHATAVDPDTCQNPRFPEISVESPLLLCLHPAPQPPLPSRKDTAPAGKLKAS